LPCFPIYLRLGVGPERVSIKPWMAISIVLVIHDKSHLVYNIISLVVNK